LINIIQDRKDDIDISHSEIIQKTKTIYKDSTLNNEIKKSLSEDLLIVKNAKREFDNLIKKQINTLNKNQMILVHELHTKIHNLPKKYGLESLDVLNSSYINYSKQLKELILENEKLNEQYMLECEDCFNEIEEKERYLIKTYSELKVKIDSIKK